MSVHPGNHSRQRMGHIHSLGLELACNGGSCGGI